jgi:hypothetical protein
VDRPSPCRGDGYRTTLRFCKGGNFRECARMFRDDLRNSPSRPVLAALAVLTMSTVALAAPQIGANKVELQEPSAKRLVLDSNDVSRIGVQTVPVREEKVVRRVVVLGKVEDEPADNAGTDAGDLAPAAATELAQNDASSINDVQIRVLLDKNPADDADDDAGQYDDEDDAEIVAPGDDDEDETPVRAKRVLIQGAPNTLYFKVKSGTQGLQAGQSVGVRLAEPGSNIPKKVVPYSAILYDLTGDTWVYTNPEPSVFVREQVDIERIDDDLAVLNSGPAAGTQVVTIGAAELYGAESRAGK